MKKLLILLMVVITACNSKINTEQKDNENANGQENTKTTVPLNNGSKWKADQATKKNVAELVQVVNDSNFTDGTKRKELYAALQMKIDTLIKQCRMQGPEHDALHVWLEKVLKDMKELKEEDDGYSQVYATLKKDIESFNRFFE